MATDANITLPTSTQLESPREEAASIPLLELNPEWYNNRELSWLNFNRRVLHEVGKHSTPLLERAKFAAIFASNLDEFFMIRVAGVKRKVVAGISDRGMDGRTPTQLLIAIHQQTQQLLTEHVRVVSDDVIPALASKGVEIIDYSSLRKHDRNALRELFLREIFPVLTPQAVDRGRRFPHISNDSLNLIVVLKSGETSRFARVKVPALIPRLVAIPGGSRSVEEQHTLRGTAELPSARLIWMEQVIQANLGRLFPGAEVIASYPFHLLRDSDVEPDEDDEDHATMLEMMRETLSQRPFGTVVRLVIDQRMPAPVREWLLEQVHGSKHDVYTVDGPLALEDLYELARLDRPDLKEPPLQQAPLIRPETGNGPTDVVPVPMDIFALLRKQDVLIHLPYQSFDAVVDFVKAAATDPDVVAIKQTLYRLGRDSPLIPALISARDDDTQVAVLVELKARFDEENNISWAQTLESHGVHVAYGVPSLKTHCKLTLVVRREPNGLRRYVHVSTGNYNANTARLYEDIGMLTSREEIADDVSQLFNVLTGFASDVTYNTLWVAPGDMRRRFIEAIIAEIDAHERHGNGHMILKMNSLVDRDVIRTLYTASQAGVKIDLIVRGICCLRPGLKDVSETIRVVSVVGRFLEHSRIYAFRNGGDWRVFIGSADVMERNFDHRVEVICPVDSPELSTYLRSVVLDAYLRDTVNAWELREDGSFSLIEPGKKQKRFDAQKWFLGLYKDGSPTGSNTSIARS